MYAEVDRLLKMGVIEPCQSPWNSPVCLVRKPGKNRFCLDSRKLNSLTVKDAYPLPHIEGLLSRLKDTHYISSIDLKDAFLQVPLANKDKEKTAFTVPGYGHFQFTTMPFGLCNAPQTLSKLMDKIFPPSLRDNIFVYLVDLLAVSETLEHHFELLKEISKRLRATESTDPDKIHAVKEFPVPLSRKQVRRFIGMTGWYRRFISNYASLASALTETLKGGPNTKFVFSSDALNSFEMLKDALTSAPILTNPDFSLSFIIQCDASTTGVGGRFMPEGSRW